MLTQQDLKNVGKLIDTKLDEKIKYLPTKTYFDERMDEVMGELQDKRDEQVLHQGQHDEITDRLDRLETHVGLSPI